MSATPQETFINVNNCKAILSIYNPTEDSVESAQVPCTEIKVEDMIRGEEAGQGRAAAKIECTVATSTYITNYRGSNMSIRCAVATEGGELISLSEGYVENVKPQDDGTQKVIAYSAVRRLNQAKFYGSYSSEPVSSVLEDIFATARVKYQFQEGTILDAPEEEEDEVADGEEVEGDNNDTEQSAEAVQRSLNGSISFDFTGSPCLTALEEVCGQNNLRWFIDKRNNVCVARDLYESELRNVPFKTGETVDNVSESSPGPKMNPYQRVIVYGGSPPVGSTEGRGNNRPSRSPSASPPLGWAETQEFRDNPEDYDTFETEDEAAVTPQACENMAFSVLSGIFEKQKKGTVTISGDGTYKPFDYIQMPDDEKYNYQGEQMTYMVSGVTHEINVENGFKTTLNLAPFYQTNEDAIITGSRFQGSSSGSGGETDNNQQSGGGDTSAGSGDDTAGDSDGDGTDDSEDTTTGAAGGDGVSDGGTEPTAQG